ncbi:cyclohexanone monooxygenase [Hyaloraphidium curvatum]|nr:cyclohexanone monooxygenase [Hyaloraphidium curvatum]
MPDSGTAKPFEFDFDPAELHKKYLAERDRRVRSEHTGQYITCGEGKGAKFAHWLQDPWNPRVEREPIDADVDCLVLGAGFSGIFASARLKQAGVKDFKVLDKASGWGGTWYWNRYPGSACDSEAYCYLPLLEETGYMPSQKYINGWEIRKYCGILADHFGLNEHAVWQTEAKDLRWSDTDGFWTVTTDRGDTFRARFVVAAGGPINVPHLPDVPGIETFGGHEFHTARWDYAYTGGKDDGEYKMEKLKDKRVAIIGTGATSIQCVPYLGEWAKELYVFQRTPSAVDVRDNKPTDPAWWKSLPKGWQNDRDDSFQLGLLGIPGKVPLDDGFSKSFQYLSSLARAKAMGEPDAEKYSLQECLELADYQLMNRIRARCDEVVEDKKTAEALKPWYRLMCKRPVYSDTYLQTFNKPSVHLVDVADDKGIEGVTEKGIIGPGGKLYEVDCIIWSTGFDIFGLGVEIKNTFSIYGRGGVTRAQKYEKEGVATLFGICTSEFPNLFYYGHAQGAVSTNFTSVYRYYSEWVAFCISEMLKRGVKVAEVTKDAEEEWSQEVLRVSTEDVNFRLECTPGYYNAEGDIEKLTKLKRGVNYGAGPLAYYERLKEFMNRADFREFKMVN